MKYLDTSDIDIRRKGDDLKESYQKITSFFDADYSNPISFFEDRSGKNQVYFAFIDLKPVGYFIWNFLWGNTPFIELIRIIPEYQNKNIGTLLLSHFEQDIKKKGFNSYLSSTEQSNTLSIRFHEKNNLQQIGIINAIYGPEIFFKKDL